MRPWNGRRWATILMTGGAAAVIVGGAYLAWPFLTTLTDSEELRRVVSEAGAWGPVIYVAIQVLQVLIAPIPGQVISLVGGVLFGAVWGVAYTMIRRNDRLQLDLRPHHPAAGTSLR